MFIPSPTDPSFDPEQTAPAWLRAGLAGCGTQPDSKDHPTDAEAANDDHPSIFADAWDSVPPWTQDDVLSWIISINDECIGKPIESADEAHLIARWLVHGGFQDLRRYFQRSES